MATPLRWDELDERLEPRRLTMDVVRTRVREHGDLYTPLLKRAPAARPGSRSV